jgi:hypothetical protein
LYGQGTAQEGFDMSTKIMLRPVFEQFKLEVVAGFCAARPV